MAAHLLHVENSHLVEMSTAVEQNGRWQDLAISGTTVSGKKYIAVFDGHGTNSVINAINKRNTDGNFATIMDDDCPVALLQQRLTEDNVCSGGESSGSTMSGAVLDGNLLKIFNCGDSRTFVFRNGVLELITEEHSPSNPKERAQSTHDFIPNTGFRTITDAKLEEIRTEYTVVTQPGYSANHIAMTRSLGHSGFLNPTGDLYTVVVEPTDEIMVVSVTDGVTDMLVCDETDQTTIRAQDICMLYELSAEELKNNIQNRWGQIWTVNHLSGQSSQQQWRKRQFDDIGIAKMVIRNKPI